MEHNQHTYPIRCEWGERGVRALAPISQVIVIVDVLSFSTCVDVATSRGALVYPYRWKDSRGEEFAKEKGAILAGRRDLPGYTLSPTSLQEIESETKLVLPSPNGSTLTSVAEEYSVTVIAGCLRNARAIGRWLSEQSGTIGLIPAGERWSDGSLRPSLEDWIGAGAILSILQGERSPEAQAAVDTFNVAKSQLEKRLHDCSSGYELVEMGFSNDVSLASELNVSECVPILQDGRYTMSNSR